MGQNIKKYNTPISFIQEFGKHLEKLISIKKPDFIIPLETKGAILLGMALDSMNYPLPKNINIIYPRALVYIDNDKMTKSNYLIIDDAVFSGKSLKQVYSSLIEEGVKESNITLAALLDFAAGKQDIDYHFDIYRKICFPQLSTLYLTRDEGLRYIHNAIMSERMPSTYDHLLFENHDVKPWQYNNIISTAADLCRLLDYSRRGSFLTSSILLEDIIQGNWDFPPKLRFWYNPDLQILRAAPIASPNVSNLMTTKKEELNTSLKEIENIFTSGIRKDSKKALLQALYDARTFNARLQILPHLYSYLNIGNVESHLEQTHLCRYYPSIDHKLIKIIHDQKECPIPEFTKRKVNISSSPFSFIGAAKTILNILRESYESQGKLGRDKKDFETTGYTGAELFGKLTNYTHEQIHAAIDYCFDMNYSAAFIRWSGDNNEKPSRAMRTTEITCDYHHAEVYASTIIYAQDRPTPAWLISKIFPIVSNCGGGPFDGFIVIQKGPFGDYSKVIMSEESTLYWRDIESELWDIEGSEENRDLKFLRKKEKEDVALNLHNDQRIKDHIASIQAAMFLCNQFGRKGAILLDIGTGLFGGTDYLSYNIEKIMEYTLSKEPRASHHLRQQCDGVLEKIELIGDLFENRENNILVRLLQRCSRLRPLVPLIERKAIDMVNSAKFFSEKRIYNSFEKLAECIISIKNACQKNQEKIVQQKLSLLGIRFDSSINYSANQLLFYSQNQICNYIYALSKRECCDKHYEDFMLQGNNHGKALYIIACDLAGTRKTHATNVNVQVQVVNRAIKTMCYNWIIAEGGLLSDKNLDSGDLFFGFFQTLIDAIQAASWMTFHSQQLSEVNPLIPSQYSFGIAITRGYISRELLNNISSKEMDWSAHCLKGKLKNTMDDIAGTAGRQGTIYQESPIQIICHDDFIKTNITELPIIVTKEAITNDGEKVEILALDWLKYLKNFETPWQHKIF